MDKIKRVLVVEDEAIIAEDLRLQMEQAGYQVVGAVASGEEALEVARSSSPDLVLMDVNLRGGMDGTETARRLRETGDFALIFMTAYSDPATLARAKMAAPEGYLLKPYNKRELEATMAMAVEKHRLESEVRRAHARFRAALLASPDAILLVRSDGRPVEAAAGERELRDLVLEPARARALECVKRCTEHARIERFEFDGPPVDGGARRYELRAAPVDLDECIVIVRDVTEQRDALRRASESMRLLHSVAQKMQAAREDERKDMAREIHDSLGQHMIGLKMELASSLALLPRELPPKSRARFDALVASADGVIEEVRRITTKLRPLVLDDLGLPAALQWLCEDFEKRTRIRCQFTGDEALIVDAGRATALFRIVQEALTNAARHSQASAVTVILKKEDAALVLSVRDNGRGISEAEQASRTGHGLTAMRERAALWGGESGLTSLPAKGTILTVRLPLERQPRESV